MPRGFFSLLGDRNTVKTFQNSGQMCVKCGLFKTCNTPRMKPSGGNGKNILVVAEAPGETEDVRGTQLIGSTGKLLARYMRKHGVDLDDDCRKINAVNCRPPRNRTPKDPEIMACRPMLLEEIKKNPPHIIIPLGNCSVKSVIGSRISKGIGGIEKWRGECIPDQHYRAWICPMYHPSYIIRMGLDSVAGRVFDNDMEKALEKLGEKVPEYGDEKKYVKILSPSEAVAFFF